MQKVKSFTIEATRAMRGNPELSAAVEETLNEFVKNADIVTLSQSVDFSSGPHGKAFVTVVYENKKNK